MSFLHLLIYFFLYSFFGWIVDTTWRSIDARHFKTGSFFPVPLCPVYGFGALLILALHYFLSSAPLVVQGVVYGIALALLEHVGGVITLKFFHRRLWKYPKGVLHMSSFTNLAHLILWGLLALVFVYFIHPIVHEIIEAWYY